MSNGAMNLQLSRSSKSVWDEPGWSTTLSSLDSQRWMAVACGVALALTGARQRGVLGGLAATAGAVLATRAITGRHDFEVAGNWIDHRLRRYGLRAHDRVQDASEESFPASDSPSWTGTTGSSRRR